MTKNNLEELAIFGGPSTFKEPLHVGVPNIGNTKRFHARVDEIFHRKTLTNRGPMVIEFEEKIADLIGVKHCIAMSNATVALEIATRALGFEQEVVTPSMTFVATSHALQWQQITPVFCDIEDNSHHLNPQRVKDLITPRTTGLLPVNIWGRPCNIDAIESVATKYKLPVVYDSAHAFGCSYKGKMIGSFGNAEVFSFHATKFINSFEGGAVVTNDDELAQTVKLMQNFGFEGRDYVSHIGINGKMTEIQAAMGLTSLEAMDGFVQRNKENYLSYKEGLDQVPGIKLITYDEQERNNYQYIVIELDKNNTGITRDQMLAILSAENIDARRYFYPGCHRMEPYRSYFPNAGMLLQNTESVLEKIITLPTGESISVDQIKKITSIISKIVLNGKAISQKLNVLSSKHVNMHKTTHSGNIDNYHCDQKTNIRATGT